MIRRLFIGMAGAAALALAPQPLAAQADPSAQEMDQAMAALGAMFPAEPLTPEQEARLPQTQRIINRVIPEGTLGEMMGGMFDKLLGPILGAAGAPAIDAVVEGTGLGADTLDLTPEQSEELARLFDPAYAERHAREVALMPALMRDMMTVMEPTMRKAMSELYAIHFTQKELDDIEAFFQTDSGTAYARKSFTMSSDPRIISATMESLPQMMGAFAGMEQKMAEAVADLPAKRGFDALSKAEQERVAAITGRSVAEIREGLVARDAE
jgi:hypothetical protein